MTDLRELYQELILEQNALPRNFGPLANPTHTAEGYNPLCGDQLRLFLRIDKGVIAEIGFEGSGCAISKASTSLMTTTLKNKAIQEAEALFGAFHQMLTDSNPNVPEVLGKLRAFSGVREFPVRVKCATLPWHTLRAALMGHGKTSTE